MSRFNSPSKSGYVKFTSQKLASCCGIALVHNVYFYPLLIKGYEQKEFMNRRWELSGGWVYFKDTCNVPIYLKPREITKHRLTLYNEFFIFLKTYNRLKSLNRAKVLLADAVTGQISSFVQATGGETAGWMIDKPVYNLFSKNKDVVYTLNREVIY